MFREPSPRVDDLAYRVIGAAIEVHRHLGPGLAESAYRNALVHELASLGLAVKTQVPVAFEYKGLVVGEYQLDVLVEGELVVRLKAVERLAELDRAEVITQLLASRRELGLLINFNVARLKEGISRVVVPPVHDRWATDAGLRDGTPGLSARRVVGARGVADATAAIPVEETPADARQLDADRGSTHRGDEAHRSR